MLDSKIPHLCAVECITASGYKILHRILKCDSMSSFLPILTPDVVTVPSGPLFAGSVGPLTLTSTVSISNTTDTDVSHGHGYHLAERKHTFVEQQCSRVTISAVSGSR